MAEFKRGNLTSIPLNPGGRTPKGKVSAPKVKKTPVKEKRPKAQVPGHLLTALNVDSLPAYSWFNEEEKQLWEQVTGTLAAAGILTSFDTYVLRLWVESLVTVIRLRAQLKEEGEIVYSERGAPCVNPKRQSLHSEQALWTKLNAQLCLDPKSREGLRRTILANEAAKRALEANPVEVEEPEAEEVKEAVTEPAAVGF
jgi:P27 family predicted phage terminase small subunit